MFGWVSVAWCERTLPSFSVTMLPVEYSVTRRIFCFLQILKSRGNLQHKILILILKDTSLHSEINVHALDTFKLSANLGIFPTKPLLGLSFGFPLLEKLDHFRAHHSHLPAPEIPTGQKSKRNRSRTACPTCPPRWRH